MSKPTVQGEKEPHQSIFKNNRPISTCLRIWSLSTYGSKRSWRKTHYKSLLIIINLLWFFQLCESSGRLGGELSWSPCSHPESWYVDGRRATYSVSDSILVIMGIRPSFVRQCFHKFSSVISIVKVECVLYYLTAAIFLYSFQLCLASFTTWMAFSTEFNYII